MPDQPSAPRRGRPPEPGLAQRRRQQIIESAYAVFVARGYEATTISDVAAHAGIGQGTVYRYFESKREILDHVVDFGIAKFVDRVQPRTLLKRPASAPELLAELRSAIGRWYEMLDQEPDFVRLFLVEASAIDKELSDRLLGLELLVSTFVAHELRLGVAAGWIRADLDPEVTAHIVLTLSVPGLLQEMRGENTAAERERTTNGVLTLLEKALRPRDSARTVR
ncbi:putative TetR family transcriptional regulator [Nocardia brasiliensis NBRC 14402]|uniref:TetR/AcrR family transcriptional regulator n=1 Tax=Nocardia brasiliensis TaxID=37326 RepID=UPI0002EBE49E|nr:TetR/AcrR family transcriptional regulator [Nocardia brasiliensis]GAJ83475.1 putative TetR family transcriptional regulator [Nocardia brasiliensis NBRC 14402]SUB48328.1 Fatty acid metabolism regulator protein [Nocardia brasiliensis]